LETKLLIEIGENATGKDASETQMILNHKETIEYIVESAFEETISSHSICSIHALLSDNLPGDPSASSEADPGRRQRYELYTSQQSPFASRNVSVFH
jgi:hypothetical protein